jgi:hypothetical protein
MNLILFDPQNTGSIDSLPNFSQNTSGLFFLYLAQFTSAYTDIEYDRGGYADFQMRNSSTFQRNL